MSQATPTEEMKQTDMLASSQLSHEKQISSNSVPGEVSQAYGIVQERMDSSCMDNPKQDGPSTSQQEVKGKRHSFKFEYKRIKYGVTCDTSQTVIAALNENKSFTALKQKKQLKETLIHRQKQPHEVKGAAVKTDFPCCLIPKNELLNIDFIINDTATESTETKANVSLSSKPEDFVTFYIKTKGGEKLSFLMKSNALRSSVDDVCVYASKEQSLRTALMEDGRFIDDIYDDMMHCVLEHLDSDTRYEMSSSVEDLDQQHFQIILISDKRPEHQKKQTPVKTEDKAASACAVADDKEQQPINNEPMSESKQTNRVKKQKRNTINHQSPPNEWKPITDSKEILDILRDQYTGLLMKLKERMKFKDESQVRKFFRAEYNKSCQSFSEVKKVREIVELSKSVCQIRLGGNAIGTGFLFFGHFILTNAHVIRDYLDTSGEISSTYEIKAAFDYECLESVVKLVQVKKQLAAKCLLKDNMNRRIDFALLEVNDDQIAEITDYPRLLSRCSPGPTPDKGGICIVGHPHAEVKKMDPCFIIERENIDEAGDKHIKEHSDFINVITQKYFEDKWDIYENQITYDSCFFHGSSGSPVFNEQCNLIGLHTGGYVYHGANEKTQSVMEFCYSIQPILDHIKGQARIIGRDDILKIIEGNSSTGNVPTTAQQQNEADYKMENVEKI